MNYTNKIYITLLISFILLFSSLALSYKNIHMTNSTIKNLERFQMKFSYLVNKLNIKVESVQADILQAIILENYNLYIDKNGSSKKIIAMIRDIEKHLKRYSVEDAEIDHLIDLLKTRVIAYKIVENSLLEAIDSKNKDDIEDAIIGYNDITVKFSQDISTLKDIANTNLYSKFFELEKMNSFISKTLIFSFILAFILIGFSIYKFAKLHQVAKKELKRAEEAEAKQQELQAQLIRYNEDLEEEIKIKTDELHKKIFTNTLTGLANRNKLIEDQITFRFKQIALLNIDKFQKFNDVYGEDIGNVAIKLTAEFLEQNIDDEQTHLYHLNGDEFAVAVNNSNGLQNEYFKEKIETILNMYKNHDFMFKDKKFRLIMSAGLSFSGHHKIMAYADMALKDAKKKNIQLSVFHQSKQLEHNYKEDIKYHQKLIKAFEDDNVKSFFQPISPIQDSNKPMKYESLVRIVEEDGNVIPPFNFINIAKQNRLYHKLTRKVLTNTLDAIEKHNIACSLNISMEDIESEKTLKMLYNTFDTFEKNDLITIELLETEEFKDYELVQKFCTTIRSFGIKIALDDFGSGYSNFSHVLNLAVDYIKIDASLISNIDRDPHSRIMVETIVGLAKKLNVLTIAEFVSSKEILDIVKEIGVDYAQGYYIGKPEPIENYLLV